MIDANVAADYLRTKEPTLGNGFKLHALLYYSQAWHLAATGKPLFDNKIIAHEDGPIVEGVPYDSD